MIRRRLIPSLTGAIVLGCSSPAPDMKEAEALAEAEAALSSQHTSTGKRLFSQALPDTNGRSCATCHVLDESTVLRPANVEARLAANPQDPLFNRLDADDPEAPVLTYEHLKKGLVRVTLPLPANMDVIDAQGHVITPPDRRVSVWRAVPSIQDTAINGPFQLDGRETHLEAQAQSALTSHSEAGEVPLSQLRRIADFERGEFSSFRARFVARQLEDGVPLEEVPLPEDFMWLTVQEQRGREVFKAACLGCHGSATTARVEHPGLREAAASAPMTRPDGNVVFNMVPGVGPVPVLVPRTDADFFNVGFGIFTYLGQLGQFPAYNASVELPRYRFRFYTDGTRQQQVTDLPPIPVTASGDPYDPNPAVDENGAPIVGPNFLPQWFTTDPGRALVTGNPRDFEAFDIPQLRGVARTAPYFHDNSHETLPEVVDTYSRFILPLTPQLELPAVHPPEFPGGPPESLSPAQKQDLLRFLDRL